MLFLFFFKFDVIFDLYFSHVFLLFKVALLGCPFDFVWKIGKNCSQQGI